ncbi:MAG TPA: metalloregulator ArsR/SmtB family transcription factor [Bryobacteraceae bacterium]|nr:metalloregulator ArsR/SmtB family transcription factor [Bryobacteraceae bacterium]
MHAFDILGDPVRRRILELLASGERGAGDLTGVIRKEFGITQAGVSQHLRTLRESGFVRVRVQGARRIYSVESQPLQQVDAWIGQFRGFWERHLRALTGEIARGKAIQKRNRGKAAEPYKDGTC